MRSFVELESDLSTTAVELKETLRYYARNKLVVDADLVLRVAGRVSMTREDRLALALFATEGVRNLQHARHFKAVSEYTRLKSYFTGYPEAKPKKGR